MTIGAASETWNRPLRSFVAVSGELEQTELLDALSADEHDYGVIFVDSIARSYSRIKQIVPDIVIVYCAIDDLAACQLLSMLKQDGDLSGVRVVTCSTAPADDESIDGTADMPDVTPGMVPFLSLN